MVLASAEAEIERMLINRIAKMTFFIYKIVYNYILILPTSAPTVLRDKRFTVAAEEARGCPLLTTDVIRA
jgi:hypothetical protein